MKISANHFFKNTQLIKSKVAGGNAPPHALLDDLLLFQLFQPARTLA
ncbi:hypothetical protein OIK44_16480 [Janthinobacterium sp. hw3]|uniref:Uncharacterized protein n=1 Tax=Janthinobacterium fluminis TaxID=2987524 RepID=A0ABT5K2T2_9BURK|nr:hypothetical protein [Janthinobacterium fluminis]